MGTGGAAGRDAAGAAADPGDPDAVTQARTQGVGSGTVVGRRDLSQWTDVHCRLAVSAFLVCFIFTSYVGPLKVEGHTWTPGGSNSGQVPGTHSLHSSHFPISGRSHSSRTVVLCCQRSIEG